MKVTIQTERPVAKIQSKSKKKQYHNQTYPCRSLLLDLMQNCPFVKQLTYVALKSFLLADHGTDGRAFYKGAVTIRHTFHPRNPVLPVPRAEKCIRNLSLGDTSQPSVISAVLRDCVPLDLFTTVTLVATQMFRLGLEQYNF